MERYTDGTGQKFWGHEASECEGSERCVIHKPSKHSMSEFPTHWRNDRGLMERICPHGIGHPDPDSMWYRKAILGLDKEQMYYESIHGCDGCCVGAYKEKKDDIIGCPACGEMLRYKGEPHPCFA